MSEIKINELKGFLKSAAEQANLNGDKKIKGDEEIDKILSQIPDDKKLSYDEKIISNIFK